MILIAKWSYEWNEVKKVKKLTLCLVEKECSVSNYYKKMVLYSEWKKFQYCSELHSGYVWRGEVYQNLFRYVEGAQPIIYWNKDLKNVFTQVTFFGNFTAGKLIFKFLKGILIKYWVYYPFIGMSCHLLLSYPRLPYSNIKLFLEPAFAWVRDTFLIPLLNSMI